MVFKYIDIKRNFHYNKYYKYHFALKEQNILKGQAEEYILKEYKSLSHIFEPVFDEFSKVLILGTFPSVKSRENHFYYGHPQNRFWKILTSLVGDVLPGTVEEKKAFLLRNKIAIWDVIASCDIVGSSDSSIKNVIPVELSIILDHAPIRQIYANGQKAYQLYEKYLANLVGINIFFWRCQSELIDCEFL